MVMGEGRNPSISDLINLGREANISKIRISKIIDQTRTALSNWKILAQECGVDPNNINLIGARISRQ